MHELALCEAIVAAVDRQRAGRPVSRVLIEVGHLRQVVPDSLTFSWGLLTEGTAMAGSKLEIDHIPAVVACRDCAARTTLDLPILACGSCDGYAVDLVSGEELMVVAFDVEEED